MAAAAKNTTKPGGGMTVGFDAKRAVMNNTGLGNYSRFVIDAMSALYPGNKYLLYSPREKANPRLEPLLGRDDVELRTPQGGFSRHCGAVWRSAFQIEDWARDGLTIYHGLSNEIPLTAGMAPCPTVVTIHDLIWRRVPQDYSAIDRRIYDFKYGRSARLATRIIAISEKTRDDIVNDWGIDPAKIDVIRQGCHPQFGREVPFAQKEAICARYGLKPGGYIVAVGTVESRKNQLLPVKALPGLPPEVPLVIVGRSRKGYAERIKKYMADHRIDPGRVIWLSDGVPFDELPALYNCAALSVYTSRYEGFGLPVIESISTGTPVIAATGSCLEEAGGPGAVYIDPDDDKTLAEHACEIIAKPYLRSRMVDAGRRYVRRFNTADFAKATMACYNKALVDYITQNQK